MAVAVAMMGYHVGTRERNQNDDGENRDPFLRRQHSAGQGGVLSDESEFDDGDDSDDG